jgi:glycerophosphoryl diester phosphodiesterase
LLNTIQIHGHRGSRGTHPENTIAGFIYAIECGALAIELDIVVTGDNKILVSHEPWFNPKICLDPGGKKISVKTRGNLYQMPYSEIKKYDCGSRANPDFPNQIPFPAYKPLLGEVVKKCEAFIKRKKNRPITYNIEIKSESRLYNIYQPAPAEYVSLVLKEINKLGIANKCMVQSFDPTVLKEIKKQNNKIKTGLLLEKPGSVKNNLKKLGFTPDYYNPSYKLISKRMVSEVHDSGMKILSWTVNTKKEMQKLISFSVDGIISDYPEMGAQLISKTSPRSSTGSD